MAVAVAPGRLDASASTQPDSPKRKQRDVYRGAGARRAGDEPLVREHRPRQRLHDLQPDPGRRRGGDACVRRVAGRALPRHPLLQLGDRDRPGGAREAGARPAGRARRAERHGGPRRRRAQVPSTRSSSATWSASAPATRSSPTARSSSAALRSTSRSSPARPRRSRAPGERCARGRSRSRGRAYAVTAVGARQLRRA